VLVGLCLFYPNTIFTGFEHVQTDAEDSLFLQCIMEHVMRYFIDPGYRGTFWSPRFFYPADNALAYSENMLGCAPVYWVFRIFFQPDIAIQWWVLTMAAANYLAMAVTLRWFGINRILSTLGAYIFAFSLVRSVHQPNLLTLPQWFTPLAIYYFWSFLRQPHMRYWVLLLLCLGWQTLSSMHLGWFLGFGLASMFAISLFVDPGACSRMALFVRRHAFGFTASTAIWSASLLLFFRHYLFSDLVPVDFIVPDYYAPGAGNWFAAVPTSLWAPWKLDAEDRYDRERQLFCGMGLYSIMFAGFLFGWENRHRPERREAALFSWIALLTCAWLILVTLSLGRGLCLWYGIYSIVPGATGIRAINRVCLIVIPLGLIGGLTGVQAYARSDMGYTGRRSALYLTLLAICVIEQARLNTPTFSRRDMDHRAGMLAAEMSNADAAYFVRDPNYEGSQTSLDVACMWAGLKANRATINGYSGREPPGYINLRNSEQLVELLRFLGETWEGRLAVVQLGPPHTKKLYLIRPGSDGIARATLLSVSLAAAR